MILHRKLFMVSWLTGAIVTAVLWVLGIQVPEALGWVLGLSASGIPAIVRLLS